jgi:hypothetical protein
LFSLVEHFYLPPNATAPAAITRPAPRNKLSNRITKVVAPNTGSIEVGTSPLAESCRPLTCDSTTTNAIGTAIIKPRIDATLILINFSDSGANLAIGVLYRIAILMKDNMY